jgi:aminopeptidase N
VADPAPPTFRLPGDVRPERYRLELTIVPDHAVTAGSIHIDATVVRPTRVVWLNARELTLHAASLDGTPARVIAGGEDFVGLAADHELPPGPLKIDIAYDAPIDHERSRGIYAEKEGGDSYVYTFFEPIDARRAFPCFDEPSYKVPWQLVFHVPQNDVARGNAAIVRETPEASGMKRVELAASKPIPSYLVAFVVGPFDVIDDGVAGRAHTPVAFIVPKGRSGELAYAKQITPRVVAALEDYFAMDYPYGKLDVAVVPRYWGTMEHPGIVAMGQSLTLIRPDQQTREREEHYTNILAHELSHYWFGDLVTMAWWDDTWLNEALGEWSDMNITDAVAPAWHVRDRRVDLAKEAMETDETLAAHPIRHAVTTTDQIEGSFDNDLTYFKGSSVIRACEALVGPERWRDFIRSYVKKHAWGNATARDFLADLRAQLGPEVADLLDLYTSRAGVPLVHVTASCRQISVDTSARSLPAGVASDEWAPWPVPVCVRYGDATHSDRACMSMGNPVPMTYCPTWVIPNAGANGYQRSAIDPKVAAALFDPHSPVAKVAQPTAAEKMMVITDVRAMVNRGELTIDQSLALAPAILADPDPSVARWAVDAAAFRWDALSDELYQLATAWRVKMYGPRARALGWHRAATDSDDLEDLRRTMMRQIGDRDPTLRAEAEKLVDRWLADRTGLPDDLVDPALAAAARHGDAARFDRILAAARAPRDRAEVARLLPALGLFDDPALARRGLEVVLGHDFDLRESSAILKTELGHRETRDLAVAFATEHLDELLARMRSDEASWLLGYMADRFCDPPHVDAMRALLTPRAAKIDGAQLAVERGLEKAGQCISELAREEPALERFLRRGR